MIGTDSALEQDFGVLLNISSAVFVDELATYMEAAGFTGFTTRTGWVLRALGGETVSLKDLADRMRISSPGTLKVIAPMVGAGYLARVSGTDRRVRAIAATDRGCDALHAARTFHAQFEQKLVEHVGAEGVAAMRTAFTAVVERGAHHLTSAASPFPTL